MSSEKSASEDRARGCFWGQLIGDALGAKYEFKKSLLVKAEIEKALDCKGHLRMLGDEARGMLPGQVTDDSEMALTLAGTLIRDGTYKQESMACAYSRWRLMDPPQIGTTTVLALSADERLHKTWWTTMSEMEMQEVLEKVLHNVRSRNHASQSNGCLMRISALAVAYWNSPEELLKYGELDVGITHIHETCFDAIRVYLTAAAALIRGATPEEAFNEAMNAARTEIVKLHLEDSKNFAVPVRLSTGKTTNGDDWAMGYVGLALQMLTSNDFGEGLINSIKIGGDTDTNAAIAGALLGARFGEAAIPEDWLQCVRTAPLRVEEENGIDNVEGILLELLKLNIASRSRSNLAL